MGYQTHQFVIKNYENQVTNPRKHNRVEWVGSGISCFQKSLYSGGNFVLATLLGERQGVPVYLKNADRGGSETASHQSQVRYLNGPAVSYAALRQFNVYPEHITPDGILDWIHPNYTSSQSAVFLRNGKYYSDADCTQLYEGRKVGMFMLDPEMTAFHRRQGNLTPETVMGQWHVAEATLLRVKRKPDPAEVYSKPAVYRYFLCAVDEGRYFVSQLDGERFPNLTTVHEALECLVPPEAQEAISAGIPVKRQGEWFFVKRYETDRQFADALHLPTLKDLKERTRKNWGLVNGNRDKIGQTRKWSIDPDKDPVYVYNDDGSEIWGMRRETTNVHEPARTVMLTPDGYVVPTFPLLSGHIATARQFAQGRVFHRRDRWRTLTGEHATLHLEGWWECFPNTELRSFSMGGDID